MKKTFLLSFLFLFMFMVSTRAQINKGGIWLGGYMSYNKITDDNEQQDEHSEKTLNIRPAVGFVIKDNLVVGIQLSYTRNKVDNYGYIGSTYKGNNYGGGFFVRQYVPVINRLYVFGQADAGFSTGKAKQIQSDNSIKEIKGWSANLSITPGVSFAINKKFQIETGLSNLFHLRYAKSKGSGDEKMYTESLSTGISLEAQSPFYIGFRFLLNNKGQSIVNNH